MTEQRSQPSSNHSQDVPKVAPPGWAWVLAVLCFVIALVANVAAPDHFLAFSILGIGAGVTVLQSSRLASLPKQRRMAFAGVITAAAWIAFGAMLAFA